jgi:hypothetical protein
MVRPIAHERPDDGSLPGAVRHEVRRHARLFGVDLDVGLRIMEIGDADVEPSPAAPRQLPPPAHSDLPPGADLPGLERSADPA